MNTIMNNLYTLYLSNDEEGEHEDQPCPDTKNGGSMSAEISTQVSHLSSCRWRKLSSTLPVPGQCSDNQLTNNTQQIKMLQIRKQKKCGLVDELKSFYHEIFGIYVMFF